MENKKNQLLKEATDGLVLQAETRSALQAKIISVDKQAEDLMGEDDEASDILFAQKQTLETELQDLDSTHFAVNAEFAKIADDYRAQIKDLPKRSGVILHMFQEAVNSTLKKNGLCPCKPLGNKGKSHL